MVDRPQSEITPGQVGVSFAQNFPADGQGFLGVRPRFRKPVLVVEKKPDVVVKRGDPWVFGTEHLFLDSQGSLVIPLRFLEPPQPEAEAGQAGQVVRHFRMVGAVGLFEDGQ